MLALYLGTAAPGPWWGDGLELTCAAKVLGIPHPTGYPLYTVLGHGWIGLLGFMEAGRAMTLFSAVLQALAIGLTMMLAARLIHACSTEPAARTPARPAGIALPMLGSGLLVAVAWTVWRHATITEVYPLTFALSPGIMLCAWPPRTAASPGLARAAALGLLMGLAALNHYSFLALAPLAALVLVDWARRSGHPLRCIVTGLACFAAMLSGYLYLYVRARMNPPLNWGDPSTLERLVWVLSGGQYTTIKLGLDARAVGSGLQLWLRWWGEQWLPRSLSGGPVALALGAFVLAGAGAGLIRLARRRWAYGLGGLAALVMTAGFAAAYHIPDIGPYFMIALPAAMVGWICLLDWIVRAVPKPARTALTSPPMRAVPALLALAVISFHYTPINKSGLPWPRLWGHNVMRFVPHRAVILTGGDNDIYSLWYQQMVLGRRPDVAVIGSNFIFQGWYRKYFEAAGRSPVAVGVEQRRPGFKHEADAFLAHATIIPNLEAGRPVYLSYMDRTLLHFFSGRPVGPPLLPTIAYEGQAHPYGMPSLLLFRLFPNQELVGQDRTRLEKTFRQYYVEQVHKAAARPPREGWNARR